MKKMMQKYFKLLLKFLESYLCARPKNALFKNIFYSNYVCADLN